MGTADKPMAGDGRGELQEAYVVHRRGFRETSLLVDVFSRRHGLLRLLAKGACRGKHGRAAVLQPFSALALRWSGRGDLPVLVDAEAFRRHALSGAAVLCGMYVNELLVRMLPAGDPHPDLYDGYRDSLERLAVGDATEAVLRGFELSLLEAAGYAPPLEYEADSGEPVRPDRYYEYRPEHGPVSSSPHPRAVRGASLLALSRRRFADAEQLREAKRVMRLLINQALGGRVVKSRELFKYVKFVEP